MRARGKDQDMDVAGGASLYTVVQNLAKHGFLAGRHQWGRVPRPERTVYQITQAYRGDARLDPELLSAPEPEHPKFAAGFLVQMILPPDEVIALRARPAGWRSRSPHVAG